jgi:hypothetical protein
MPSGVRAFAGERETKTRSTCVVRERVLRPEMWASPEYRRKRRAVNRLNLPPMRQPAFRLACTAAAGVELWDELILNLTITHVKEIRLTL